MPISEQLPRLSEGIDVSESGLKNLDTDRERRDGKVEGCLCIAGRFLCIF